MSGTRTFALRLDDAVYDRIKKAAGKDAVSMNTWIAQTLEEAQPHDQNDLFDAEVTLTGPKHPMAIGLCDPVENFSDSVNETLKFLLEEAGRLNYWTSFNHDQIELLANLQREITKPRDAYLSAVARENLLKKNKADQSQGIAVVLAEIKIDSLRSIAGLSDLLDEFLKTFEPVSRRRNKEFARALSYSRTQAERITWDLGAIQKKIDN